MDGHPLDPNDVTYGTDGRQDGQQGLNCPNCRHFIYYTLQDAIDHHDLKCEACQHTYAVNLENSPQTIMKTQMGGTAGGGTYVYIAAK